MAVINKLAATLMRLSLQAAGPVAEKAYKWIVESSSKISKTEKLIHGRYRDHGDGTVTDIVTNIRWKRCCEGETWNAKTNTCDGKAIEYTWYDLPQPTNDGWRVPTIDELKTLLYCSNTGKFGDECRVDDYQKPAIDQEAFPSKLDHYWFWSSSADAYYSDYAWLVNFYYGSAYGYSKDSTDDVRLARAGQ